MFFYIWLNAIGMKELEQSGSALESDIVKENLKEIIFDLSQPIVETIGQAIGENIPGLSIFFKGAKAVSAIRDQDLMNKVISFLNEAEQMDHIKRKKLVDKVNKDPIYGQRFGAFVLVALDRYDFAVKAKYLARALKFYERNDISKITLIRINSAIQQIQLMDLEDWTKDRNIATTNISSLAGENFISNGIFELNYNFQPLTKDHNRDHIGKNYRTNNIVKVKVTSFGYLFFFILKDIEITDYERKVYSLNKFVDQR